MIALVTLPLNWTHCSVLILSEMVNGKINTNSGRSFANARFVKRLCLRINLNGENPPSIAKHVEESSIFSVFRITELNNVLVKN